MAYTFDQYRNFVKELKAEMEELRLKYRDNYDDDEYKVKNERLYNEYIEYLNKMAEMKKAMKK